MKTKRIAGLILVGLCSTLIGCKQNKGVKLWHAYSTENLLSDFDYFNIEEEDLEDFPSAKERDSTLRFSCMKNENEAAQLMITSDKYINEFDFELPDVTGSSGTISKENFSVAAAYYQNVDISNERDAISGLYPDALIPLENYKNRRLNHIEKDMNQALFINLVTKEDTPTGTFKGTGKLILDGQTYKIPFEVHIYDATLPSENHVKNAFGVWYEQIVNGEKKSAGADMNKKYFDFAVSKRLSPIDIPNDLRSNNDTFVNNFVEMVVKNERVSAGRLPIYTGDFSKEKVRALLQKMIDKNLELRAAGDDTINLFKKAYFYIDDEPSATGFDRVRNHDKVLFDLKKELGVQLAGHQDLYESFTHLPNIVTTPYNEVLKATNEQGGVECWCPQAQNFQSPASREIYKQRQASEDREFGEHVWWYVCNDPVSPYPNYHLDSKVITSRALSYMQYDYGINGNLFWSICYYSKQSAGFSGPRDVWTDPMSWESCAGDGQLVYPGLTFGIDGPITTLRLESILAGYEEYEYQWMIDQKVQEYNAAKGTNYVTTNLLQKYYSRLFENMISNLDVDEFEKVRIELLSLIESMNHDLDAGIAELLK